MISRNAWTQLYGFVTELQNYFSLCAYCTAPFNFWKFVDHCKPLILQRIEPSSSLHFPRDSQVYSPLTLV
jgi:hypothetical protein